MPPFPDSEYRRRVERTKARMERADVDVLLVTDPANMFYLTGYDAWSFYVHQAVVVSLEKEQPLWVGREMDAGAAEVTTWLDPENVDSYTDDYVQSPLDKHPMDYIADVAGGVGADDGTVGVEMDAYYFTAKSYQRLTRELPEAEFVDATLLVNRVRRVKSDREIEYMRQAAEIVDSAMRAAFDAIDVGVRECDVVADIYHAEISGTEAFGGEYTSVVPLMPTGEGTRTPHLTWTDEELTEDTPIIFELAGTRHRYHSPLARSAYLGDPPERVEHTAEGMIAGLEAAIDAVEPGTTAEAVERAWRETIADYGLTKESRLGYSVGIGYPPDWGEHTTSIRPGDETTLEENMTFHLIPGIWLDDVGLEFSQTVRVTSTGAEVFSDVPRELFVK